MSIEYIGPQDTATECAVCGNAIPEGRKLTCSHACYMDFLATKHLGLMHHLDPVKEHIEDRRARSRLRAQTTLHLKNLRTCSDCGERYTSFKELICEACRSKQVKEQRESNQALMQSRKIQLAPEAKAALRQSRKIERMIDQVLNPRTEPNMQTLYNCKRIDTETYRITKFDSGFVPFEHHDGTVSAYTCTLHDCDCPQGHKPSCRHRKMLPFFIESEHVDDNYFFIWDTHQWLKATGIFEEAAKANGKGKDEPELIEEGGPKPVSAAPSPQPSPSLERMRRL